MSARTLLMAAAAGVSGASLDLSFLTPGALPSGLTFTRASTGTYFDATGTMQSATTNTPRWDYDPVAHGLNGLLIEEARTNAIRNSTATGAVPGSPGTMPTNWVTTTTATGLSPQVVGTGSENGIPYLDIRIFGTVGTGGVYQVLPEATTVMAAATGQSWCYSQYIRLMAGTFNGITNTVIFMREGTSGGLTVLDHPSSALTITNAALNSQRFAVAAPFTGGGTVAFAQTRTQLTVTSASAVDITLRIGAPQMEQGAYASSVIPTSSVAVTRAVDVCSMPTGAWFNAAASSLAADFIVAQSPNPSVPNARTAVSLSDGTANNLLRPFAQLNNSANAAVGTIIAGVATNSASLGNPSAGAVSKVAGAWNGTAMVGSLNGGGTVSTAAGMPSGLATLTLGTAVAGSGSYLNGWVRRVRYWNGALSNAQLQSVTR